MYFTGDQEAWWTKENHYPTEMTFLPSSQALGEDEGVLLTIAYDGVRYKHDKSMDKTSFNPNCHWLWLMPNHHGS
jgi:hypothetical protein